MDYEYLINEAIEAQKTWHQSTLMFRKFKKENPEYNEVWDANIRVNNIVIASWKESEKEWKLKIKQVNRESIN